MLANLDTVHVRELEVARLHVGELVRGDVAAAAASASFTTPAGTPAERTARHS